MKYLILFLFLAAIPNLSHASEDNTDWWWNKDELINIRNTTKEVIVKDGVNIIEGNNWIVETRLPGTFCIETMLFMNCLSDFYDSFINVNCPIIVRNKPRVKHLKR